MAPAVLFVKAKRLPSALHKGTPTFAPDGKSILRSEPSVIFFSDIATK